MLDERCKKVLEYLVEECSEGSYRVIDINEIISAMPNNLKFDSTAVGLCVDYLEKGEYISIKYKDENLYCLTPLPFARQILESEKNEQEKTKKLYKMGSLLYLLVFVCAFLGSFLAIILYALIF